MTGLRRLNKVSGNIYWEGKLRSGTLSVIGDEISFSETKSNGGSFGTIIPSPMNSHTHIGDSFINEEPQGTLPEVVGPGGFKHAKLLEAEDSSIIKGMERSIRFMELVGTGSFIDFRENGLRGIDHIKSVKANGITPIILGRPTDKGDDIRALIEKVDGIGISSLSDEDYDFLVSSSEKARSLGKIVAMHFSEHLRENIEKVLSLSPDLLIHGIEASDEDLLEISKLKIPVAITPRSNIFYGKRPNYARFLHHGIEVLLGTDNVMVTEPDIFSEMEFLYRYQRSTERIDPNAILHMVIDNPRRFLNRFKKHINDRKFVFYPNTLLTEFEIVSKPNFHEKIPVLLM